MTWYISGPMAGYPDHNFPAFQEAEEKLTAQGYEVLSAHIISHVNNVDKIWAEFLRVDLIEMLRKCNGLILLRGWPESQGAKTELEVALRLGWPIAYFDGEELIEMSKP